MKSRIPTYEIDEPFIRRWSPRSFQEKPIADEVIGSLLEAARWAPSSLNLQPWEFIVARTQKERERFYPFIDVSNRVWCEKAPVLVMLLSKKVRENGKPNRTHAFDTGTAWGFLALQATLKGLITHPMGGFDQEMARKSLAVPSDYDLQIVIAIGYQGERQNLPEELQAREIPTNRKPLTEKVHQGVFGK